jgi:hypothetical protein
MYPGYKSGILYDKQIWRLFFESNVVDPDSDRIRVQEGKPIKIEKNSRIFIFCSAGCSILRAEGFSCSLDVRYGGPGISKLQFFVQKRIIFF